LKADGRIAKQVRTFASEKVGMGGDHKEPSIYNTMIESMANTINHAYSNIGGRWWLAAVHDVERNCVCFSFLDNGATIPRTVKKKYSESFSLIAKKVVPITPTIADSELIMSALKGEYRTQTGEEHRGKGLPRILEEAQLGHINNLVIVSAKGFVNIDNDEIVELSDRFHGTLLKWNYIKRKETDSGNS
jgi:hypothetical protein